MKSKKILVVTYYWPPGSGPGVQRWLKFVKYLVQLGWEPIVLTVKNGSFSSKDESLAQDIPNSVRVERTATLEPFSLFNFLQGKKGNESPVGMGDLHKKKSLVSKLGLWVRANFFVPDARMGWNIYAYKKALQLVSEEGIETVVTTGPPHSTHLIGYKLKSKTQKINWIADFRDPWSTIFYNQYLPRTKRAHAKDVALEHQVLKNADRVLTVSPGLVEELSSVSPNVDVIYNGYDSDDFEAADEQSSDFELTYVGNFLEGQDIDELWESIQELITEDKEFGEKLKLKFTGTTAPILQEKLKSIFKEKFEQFGFVGHKEAVKRMNRAGALLFVIPRAQNNKVIVTGKIFEYLATGKPILAIGPTDGNAAPILRDCDHLPMSDYAQKNQIKAQLRQIYNLWKNKDTIHVNHKAVKSYSRVGQTKKLVSILESMS
jgi:glycosyltransferase involved in cell wall biosynthesis